MNRRTNRGRPSVLIATAGAALALASVAQAQSSWLTPVSGSWFAPANWNPAAIPNSAATNVTIGLAGPYTVSMQNGSATCGTLSITNTGAVLNIFDNALLAVAGGSISNSGLIQISGPGAAGNLTRLQAAGPLAISGAGTLRLAAVGNGDNSSAYLDYSAAGNTITNAAAHTIAGRGRIYAGIVNNGIVEADSPGTYLILLDQPKANNGLMTASGGGVLHFRSVALTQSAGGLVQSDAGSPVQFENASITGGTLDGVGAGGGIRYFAACTVDSATMANLNSITDNSLLNIGGGGLVNNGVLTVSDPAAAGNLTRVLAAAGAVTIGGTGTLRLQGTGTGDNDSAYLGYTAAGNALTNAGAHAVRGYGRIYTNIVNNGTFNADVAGKGLFFIDQPKTNNGTITASNGGFVQFRSVSVTGNPAAQIISTDAASPVQVVNSTLSGGGFTTSGTGRFEYYGNSFLSNLTVNGTHQITDNSGVNLDTNLVNNGAWKISVPGAPGNLTRLSVNAPAVTISGSGTITLQGLGGGNGDNDSAYVHYGAAANVLTLGSSQVLNGYGRIYAGLINNGIVNADVAGKGLFLLDQPKVNNATMTASNGGVLQVRATSLTQVGGLMTTAGTGQLQLSSATLNGGNVTTTAAGPLNTYGSSTINGIVLSGVANITDNSMLSTAGFTNNGVLNVSVPGAAGNLTRLNAPGAATLEGNGEVRLNATGFNTDSAYLQALGNTSNPLTLGPGQKLSGTGRLHGNVVIQGTIEPDQPFGTPTALGAIAPFGGSLVLAPSSVFNCQLGSASSYDSMQGNSAVSLGGALNVSFAGYTPAGGHYFDIIVGSSVTGRFAPVTIPAVGSFGPAHIAYLPDRARVVMCYANCDGSNTPPSLNVNDFTCFLNRFSAAASLPAAQQITDYANCDGSTVTPVLNVNDFACFLNKFAAGCP